jgi:hypothetical protein
MRFCCAAHHRGPAGSIWVVNAYQIAMVASLLPFASLGEIYGYRRVCTWGPRGVHRRPCLPKLPTSRLHGGLSSRSGIR